MSDLGALVALVAAFDTGRAPAADQFPFSYVGAVRLELWEMGADAPTGAWTSFEPWLDQLRRRGVTSLRAAVPGVNDDGPLPDRANFGMANGSESWLLASGTRQERWRTLWRVGGPDRPEQRIWEVLVQGVLAPTGMEDVELPLPTPEPIATGNLVGAIGAAVDLGGRAGLDTSELRRALEIATAPPEPVPTAAAYQGAWLPDGWKSASVRRLIRAAFAANVFRGMGSWNDVRPPDPAQAAEYEAVSDRLFRAMLDGVVAGLNGA